MWLKPSRVYALCTQAVHTVHTWRTYSTHLEDVQYTLGGRTVHTWRTYSTHLEDVQYTLGGHTVHTWRTYSTHLEDVQYTLGGRTVHTWRTYSTRLEDVQYTLGGRTVHTWRTYSTHLEDVPRDFGSLCASFRLLTTQTSISMMKMSTNELSSLHRTRGKMEWSHQQRVHLVPQFMVNWVKQYMLKNTTECTIPEYTVCIYIDCSTYRTCV